MADMIYTPDGKGHALLRRGDFLRLVREYMGPDAEKFVADLEKSIILKSESVKGEL